MLTLLVLNAVLLFAVSLIPLQSHGIQPTELQVFVSKCSDCGGCSDDGPPRDGCYYSAVGGRPEALVCGLVLLGIVLAISRRCYLANRATCGAPLVSDKAESSDEILDRS